jgi:hypothetical protein
LEGEATTTPVLAPEALEPLAPMLARTPCRATVFSDESQEASSTLLDVLGRGKSKSSSKENGESGEETHDEENSDVDDIFVQAEG